ncbi:MAG: hypothetical protein GF334_07940 [Candidatus Altiarchaeales archaeon]|nr:hypothetical protein [Candidatus Altiarchaeales archaeon]
MIRAAVLVGGLILKEVAEHMIIHWMATKFQQHRQESLRQRLKDQGWLDSMIDKLEKS